MLGYIPGLLHAWYIIAKNPEACDDDDDGYERLPGDGGENGRVTYFYVDPRAQPGQRLQQQQQQQQQQRGYGTTESMRASQQQLLQQPQEPQQGASGQWQVRGQPQGGSDGVPPSYEQAIRGDHKVQK